MAQTLVGKLLKQFQQDLSMLSNSNYNLTVASNEWYIAVTLSIFEKFTQDYIPTTGDNSTYAFSFSKGQHYIIQYCTLPSLTASFPGRTLRNFQ